MITLTLKLTLKPDRYPKPNHNPNPTYPNKPTEPHHTVLTLTDAVDLQCAPSDRHILATPGSNPNTMHSTISQLRTLLDCTEQLNCTLVKTMTDEMVTIN